MRHARPKERLPVRLPDGAAQERREGPHVGEHTAIRRRQDVRHGEDAEDERSREQPDKRRGPGTCRTEGHGARVPRLHGQHDAGTAEEMAENRRDNQADKLPFKPPHLRLAAGRGGHEHLRRAEAPRPQERKYDADLRGHG